VRCVQCGTDMVAPGSDNHASHIGHCPKCSAGFSSVVSFPADANTELKDILTQGPSLFPSLLVA